MLVTALEGRCESRTRQVWVGNSVGNSDVAMFGHVTAIDGLHVTGEYRDRSMKFFSG